jgi:signal transduction histidine kinase/ActR/RegA family two-component response regulator
VTNSKPERVLIFAASQRDAESSCELLTKNAIDGQICNDLAELEKEIKAGAGALVLAKEALSPKTSQIFTKFLAKQPAWSFLPIIFLTSSGDMGGDYSRNLELLRPLRNATFLERPVRLSTFLSVIHAALADRRRQYEVRDLLAALEKARMDAEAASQAKSDFLANMSHEIRTPLGAIVGFSELLMEPQIEEKEKSQYLLTIKRNGNLLSALINDILDLAKVESGRIDTEAIDVSVNELMSEITSAMAPKAAMKGVALVIRWNPDVPSVIKTDPIRLKQILVNVIGNAIKFTDEGRIICALRVTVKKGRRILHIEVIDSGVGIPEDQRPRLFRPFSQADNSITRKYGGTGLGLILSRKLAQALGGDLVLQKSEPGKGSTFEITVDISSEVEKEIAKSQMAATTASDGTVLPLSQCRVLLVDDSKDNQVLISLLLKLAGAEVTTANDGAEAIEKAMAGDFDVVLMDIQMPRLGGYEATTQLREKSYLRPIVALTAHALKEDHQRCLEAGCNDYLTKPVNRLELIKAVKHYYQNPFISQQRMINSPSPLSSPKNFP